MVITEMTPQTADAVLRIYESGVRSGLATFTTQIPSWEEWDRGHLPHSRLVAREGDDVVGWAALSPVSPRHPYRGVAEASIYIHPQHQGRGIGSALLDRLIESSERHGIWTLYGALFRDNAGSLALLRKRGFREIGYREKIAELNAVWRDTVLFERRSRKVNWPSDGAAGEAPPPSREQRNKQVIVDLLREIDRHNLDCLEDFYHPDYLEHNRDSSKSHAPGIAGVRFGLTAFAQAFDNYHHTVDDLVAEGDRVSARITFSGTFARPLFGFPPTGRPVVATGIAIYRIVDGKIREKWGYFDAMEHLGLAKPG